MHVTFAEFQANLPELLDRAAAGEEVVILRDGRPVARVVTATATGGGPFRRRVRLTGTLEAAGTEFRLRLADGQPLRLVPGVGSADAFARQIGQAIAVYGTAVYGPPGDVFLEAEALCPAVPEDGFFGRLPGPPPHWLDLGAVARDNAAALQAAFGRWPGEETDEQVEAALRELA